jgi:hypothetical protein
VDWLEKFDELLNSFWYYAVNSSSHFDGNNFCMFVLIISGTLLGYLYSPFPHWPTYFLLWKNVLFNKEDPIPLKARIVQSKILLKIATIAPFYTFLWYLDEILYPSYNQERVNPIFIVGEPRSGTTFLHRTMAEDEENFLAIRHIEWRFPFITIQKLIKYFNLEEKIKKMNYWPNNEAGKKAEKMHSNTLYDWEEDDIFFEELYLRHLYVALRFPYKSFLASILDDFNSLPRNEQLRIMGIHHKVIQKISYLGGENKIYLSKEPFGQRKLNLIAELYPQAKFIINLRHSSDFVSSYLKLNQESTHAKTGINVSSIIGFQDLLVERLRIDSSALLDFIKCKNISHIRLFIHFDQLVTNVEETIKSIYCQLGITLPNSYEEHLKKVQKGQKIRERGYFYDKNVFRGFTEFDTYMDKIRRP